MLWKIRCAADINKMFSLQMFTDQRSAQTL